ncbi:response regulator transcription factor [Kitasatospora saccharophila]|uniref:response regulator transcription factor n=1 Tax=Kitasatospora saccharophila TaxID=407973 RepID=UPI0031D1E311
MERTNDVVRVLLVGDHSAVIESVLYRLLRKGYQARIADTGREALEMIRDVDLVLLDLDLPDIEGVEACRRLRASGTTPVIAFAASGREPDRVLALQAGADDCVTKSCPPQEIVARIEAVMRRTRTPAPGDAAVRDISLRPLHINGRTREVRVDGRVVNVTAKEFELLYVLASNPGAVVSRKELMAKVWESDWTESSRTIDTHVSSLRGKLGGNQWIITVRGVGYRIGSG